MKMTKRTTLLAGLVSLGMAFGDPKIKTAVKPDMKAKPAAGQMQVEEPSLAAVPAPERDAKISKAQRNRARGLTAEQKQAFRERKEKMQEMITLITEKRRALQAAKPEERAALARELHSLILEKDPDAGVSTATASTARVLPPDGKTLNAAASVNAEAAAKEKQEEQLKAQQDKWQRKYKRDDD
jgi:hypothetical protein